jgi:glycerophosphoryl diester phosphodiesterase
MTALRLAHRGDWRVAPENSLAAMEAALANPACGGLEFDVRTSADGVPVLNHDATLERVHGRPEAVGALPAGELRAIGLATLEDVLAIVPRDAFLDIELKSLPGPGASEVIERFRGRDGDRTVVSSFDPVVLRAVADWPWPRWGNAPILGAAIIELAKDLGCAGLAVDWHAIQPEDAVAVREAGLTLAAWTVRDRATFDRLEALGVTAMCVEAEALDG